MCGPKTGRVFAPMLRCALHGSPSLQAVFVSTGTLCRPLRCKGRGQVPARPEAGRPLHRTARMPSCSSGMRLRTGTVAVASSVVPMACPKPAKDAAMPRRSSWGKRGTCLRAPGLRLAVRDRHTTCKPWPVLTSLRDRSARPPYGGRTFTLLSIGQHRPAHAPRGSLRSAASTSCIDPPHRQGIAPIAPRSKPRTQGGPLKKRPPGPGAAAVARALVRPGRSSL